jgi:hypothetical protein
MKKIIIPLFALILLSSLIAAQSLDIEFPQGSEFEAGEAIIFKVTLYNDQGNPIDGKISVTIEDEERKARTTKTISSKEIVTLDLGEKATSGQGIITAEFEDTSAIAFFEIGRQELARFDLDDNTLIVTNIGNTKYSRVIQITIGQTTGTQEPNLDPGESVTYRLIAPDGTYNVKVEDGKSPPLSRGEVHLIGTGQVIGAIDETPSKRTGITGVTSPDEDSDIALLSYIKRNKFVYIFIAVIFGAMILIGIERRYKRKAS